MSFNNDDCHVFISFEAHTLGKAKSLQKFLRDQKYLTVTLSSETNGKRTLTDKLANNIRNSRVILWCLTNLFVQSESCLDQIYYAIELKKPIIRLMFEDVDIGKLGGLGLSVAKTDKIYLNEDQEELSAWPNKHADHIMTLLEPFVYPEASSSRRVAADRQSVHCTQKSVWIQSDLTSYFFKSDEKIWFQKEAGLLIASFELVSESDSHVVLCDMSRSVYLKLGQRAAFSGSNMNEINEVFMHGTWLPNNSEGKISARSVWKKDSINSFFRKEKTTWCEYSNDEKVFEFRQIDENESEVVVFDEARNMYLKLCELAAYWGSAPDRVNKELNVGAWSAHGYKLVQSGERLAWKKKCSNTYLYKHSASQWCEKQNGKVQFHFTEMVADDKEVVLFDETRRMFVRLSCEAAFCGFKMTSIDKVIDHGNWLKVINVELE